MSQRYGVAVRHRDNNWRGGCFSVVVGDLYRYAVPCGARVGDELRRYSKVSCGERVFVCLNRW